MNPEEYFVKPQFVFSDIGGMLVHSVLKSNQIAQQVIADGAKSKQNGGNPLVFYLYKNKTNTLIII